jgi:hypothetical protein
MPCGIAFAMPPGQIAQLRGAGVEVLVIKDCYHCHERHEVPWPESLRKIEVDCLPVSATLAIAPAAWPLGKARG